jgi:hypothetical protein
MKLWTELGVEGVRTVFCCETEDYDGFPPLTRVSFRSRLRTLNRDREAVGLSLLFYPYISGSIAPKNGCSPSVASAIETFFEPRRVFVNGIDWTPKGIPTNSRTAVLSDESTATVECMSTTPHDVLFRLADDQSFGSNLSLREISISSNVKLLFSRPGTVSILPLLGLLILSAEDYSIGRVVLPATKTEGSNPWYDLERLRLVCSAINIEIVTPLLTHRTDTPNIQHAAAQTFYRKFRPNRTALETDKA